MPNCDFYAAGDDLEKVLRFVFEEMDCRVFDSYSEPGKELLEFHNLEEPRTVHAIGAGKNEAAQILLQLWPTAASGNAKIRKIDLRQKQPDDPKFRYCIEGWGLIQLHLGGCDDRVIIHSHTNCFSEKGAHRHYLPSMDFPDHPAKWDWKVVTGQSGKLNRFIRKSALSKHGSRPILPHAHDLVGRGLVME